MSNNTPLILTACLGISAMIWITGTNTKAIAHHRFESQVPAALKIYSTCPNIGWALFIPGKYSHEQINRAVPNNTGIFTCTHEFQHSLEGEIEIEGTLVAIPANSYDESVQFARDTAIWLKTDRILIIFTSDRPAG